MGDRQDRHYDSEQATMPRVAWMRLKRLVGATGVPNDDQEGQVRYTRDGAVTGAFKGARKLSTGVNEWQTFTAYTDEDARDAIGTALVAGNNIDITVSDPGNTITIDVETLTSADITDFSEAVDDRVGALVVAGNNIDVTYNDGANTLTIDVEALTSADVTDFSEAVDDRVGALLVAGNNIDLTYSDVGNTLTIDVESLTSADLTDFATAVDERARDAVGTALVAGNNIDITVSDGSDTITIDVEGLVQTDIAFLVDDLADKQPLDGDLSGISSLSTNGLATRTATDTWTTRSIAATGAGVSITNGDGVAGDPTVDLDATLDALASYIDAGLMSQTSLNVFVGRTIIGTANKITVTDGNGAAGNPTLTIPNDPVLGGTSVTLGAVKISNGTSSPESAVTGSKGDIFCQTDGIGEKTLWLKHSGSATNTGWRPIGEKSPFSCRRVQRIMVNPGATTVVSGDFVAAPTLDATLTNGDGANGTLVIHTTGGVSGNNSRMLTATTVAQRQWSPIFTARIQTQASVANIRLWVVLSDNAMVASATPTARYAGFRYDTTADSASAFWRIAVDANTGAPTVTATTSAIAANTSYLMRIEADGGTFRFYIDDVYQGSASSNIPAAGTGLAEYISVTTLTGSARALGWGWTSLEQS